jgi:hypothetical protein
VPLFVVRSGNKIILQETNLVIVIAGLSPVWILPSHRAAPESCRAEPWRAINPYRGLVALEEQDADFFFGRDHETGDIIEKIIAKPGRLIALVGNSGVGKSSLVQAGVIGSLMRQRSRLTGASVMGSSLRSG